jgi:uncharacterized cupin superfamily protein
MQIEVRRPTEDEIISAGSWPTWKKEESEFSWSYSEKETCLILEGRAEVETVDGDKVMFGTGDWVVFPVGLECTWRIIEPIKKKYNFA